MFILKTNFVWHPFKSEIKDSIIDFSPMNDICVTCHHKTVFKFFMSCGGSIKFIKGTPLMNNFCFFFNQTRVTCSCGGMVKGVETKTKTSSPQRKSPSRGKWWRSQVAPPTVWPCQVRNSGCHYCRFFIFCEYLILQFHNFVSNCWNMKWK